MTETRDFSLHNGEQIKIGRIRDLCDVVIEEKMDENMGDI